MPLHCNGTLDFGTEMVLKREIDELHMLMMLFIMHMLPELKSL